MEYDILVKEKLVDYMMTFVSEERKKRFEDIIINRTKHLTVVIEDVYQAHNASAVLRSCDLTGVQDVHIIENKNDYDVNPEVAMGSSKWLNIMKYNNSDNNTLEVINSLKESGYKIVATTPHKKSYGIDDIPIDEKTALLFGTELTGLSDIAIENSDEILTIPMFGFTESYNISVSAALCLYTLTQRLRKSEIKWQLNPSERIDILINWARNSVNNWHALEKHFFDTII
ncbi:MAG: rRNA methyltransferase [Lentimicrobiaceae bacterium]|jgi:tRNA (guanosine-2'-O-)-methyltransferase|nr:rRNA methyltransferase [Lentimicrobiaceae bacterium]MDG1900825.1 RNA methyltransferase [Bacteroidales bacterium]MDG2080851.1 RNA methyltransferase [Bacteroidales bacterium]